VAEVLVASIRDADTLISLTGSPLQGHMIELRQGDMREVMLVKWTGDELLVEVERGVNGQRWFWPAGTAWSYCDGSRHNEDPNWWMYRASRRGQPPTT
jgi:hypothetical protein